MKVGINRITQHHIQHINIHYHKEVRLYKLEIHFERIYLPTLKYVRILKHKQILNTLLKMKYCIHTNLMTTNTVHSYFNTFIKTVSLWKKQLHVVTNLKRMWKQYKYPFRQLIKIIINLTTISLGPNSEGLPMLLEEK